MDFSNEPNKNYFSTSPSYTTYMPRTDSFSSG